MRPELNRVEKCQPDCEKRGKKIAPMESGRGTPQPRIQSVRGRHLHMTF